MWSDHGFHIGEKQNWEKFALWDQTTRVPFFVHAPGVSVDGVRTRQPVTLTDIYPTLCELAGLPVPKLCNGNSLVPQLKNPNAIKDKPALTAFQFWKEDKPSLAIADSRYRFIRYGDGFEELYDLETDPNEFQNLISDPGLVKVKMRLVNSLPRKVMPMQKIPQNSPFHRGRKRK